MDSHPSACVCFRHPMPREELAKLREEMPQIIHVSAFGSSVMMKVYPLTRRLEIDRGGIRGCAPPVVDVTSLGSPVIPTLCILSRTSERGSKQINLVQGRVKVHWLRLVREHRTRQ